MAEQLINGGLQYVPKNAVQYVYLDFDGELTAYNGEILSIENVQVQNSSLTGERIANILESLNQKYFSQGVVFVTEPPVSAPYSTIFIGKTTAFDAYGNFTGLAETIDKGNLNKSDNAFVNLDLTATDTQIISTISHETDHLLGTLNHGGEGLAAYAEYIQVKPGVTSSGVALEYYDSMVVSSTGTVSSTTVGSKSILYIEFGAVAYDTVVNEDGELYVSNGGNASNTTVNYYGSATIYWNGSASNITVNNRGFVHVYGETDNITVNSDANLYVYNGGTATNINWTPCVGKVIIEDGAYVTFTSQYSGVYYGSNNQLTSNPETVTSKKLDWEDYMYVMSNGAVSEITVDTYGYLYVNDGGTASNTTVNSYGELYAYSGGTVDNTTMTQSANFHVYSGATANNTTVNNMCCLYVVNGGTANNTTVNDWGSLYVSANGNASNTTVNKFGVLYIASALADSTTVNRGEVFVEHYGKASNTIVDKGGRLYVSSGGSANLTMVNNDGELHISSGGSTYDVTVSSGGAIYVSSGASASEVNLLAGGILGGFAFAEDKYFSSLINGSATISDNVNITGNYMEVSSKGIASGTTVLSSGYLYVRSGGMAEDTVVKATGGIYLENGGTASNTTMNDDGELFISSGGVHKGTLQIEEDAYVFVHDGGKIDFTLSDRTTEDDYLLNDLSLVSGTPSYTITISENQAYGTYKLAQGASAFTETISIGTASTTYGSITVNGEDFVYDGITYSLDQIDGNLTIYIDDITPPEKPIVVADITEMTNKDITITATYTDDSAVKQYKINDGEWQDYTEAITVTENTTLYFRAADEAGNVSEVTEYVVDNIDKVAPDQPTVTADITIITNQNVTVTAVFTDDSAVKQYKIADGEWQDYTEAITVAENTTLYFRAADEAGNISEVTEYVVDNIVYSVEINGTGMTHADAVAAGCELIITTGGTYEGNIGHDGVEALIEGGTFNCTVGGGAVTSSADYKTWNDQETETDLTITGGTFNKVVMGGDRIDYGNGEHIGNLNLTIKGGIFNSQIAGGMAYTDQSLRGQALMSGDINMTLAGGTFESRIYGGCISTENYSTRTAIEGNVNIVVDSSKNELIFADNVYIVAGSYQSGAIDGNVQVTFTGLGENLKMDADNLVWGGSSSDVYLINGDTRTFQTSISGTRTICFNGFTGEFNTGIRGFNVFTAENGSKLEILASNQLRDIEQWNLDWDTQLSGSFQNDFKGDTMNIDLTGWDQTATDLFDCAAGTFTGFEAMKEVTIGGETATYSAEITGYVSTNYMLTLRDNQAMQLSMNTTIA